MVGEYKEKLSTGGELVVSQNSWSIEYYFSGPDYRYNGSFIRIPGDKVDDYINAWRNNYIKYHNLKSVIPAGGTYETLGEMGMSIRIGILEGVCLKSYHMPIISELKLNQVIRDYVNAKVRAEVIQNLLQNV